MQLLRSQDRRNAGKLSASLRADVMDDDVTVWGIVMLMAFFVVCMLAVAWYVSGGWK